MDAEESPYRREASNDNIEVTASNQFIANSVTQSTDDYDDDKKMTSKHQSEEITDESNLSNKERRIWVITTAGLPWRTGTAVNPLLRALYLTRGRPTQYVTLMIPWLEKKQAQKQLYGQEFETQADQEAWIREYCRDRANCSQEEKDMRIRFWKGMYHTGFGSIFPVEDICSLIPKEEADVAILEEPEHLNWWRTPPKGKTETDIEEWDWAQRFKYVIGVLHTNYGAYMKQYGLGTSFVTAPALNALSALVVRAYCHRLVRLSSTLTSLDQDLEVTSNIHGVRDEFFQKPSGEESDDTNLAAVYFIGKIVWAKGFDKILELQEHYRESTGWYFPVDVYGGGEDTKSVKLAFFGRHSAEDVDRMDDSDENGGDGGDGKAASVFAAPVNLREMIQDSTASAPTPGEEEDEEEEGEEDNEKRELGPVDVFADLSEKTLQSGAEAAAETANAALKMIESVVEHGIGAFSKKEPEEKDARYQNLKNTSFSLAPARSRFKWRKTPLPARFLGVKDHIELRELPAQKIFLNMSTTEVLCTTSAEALAMGKFVILPRHPSNEFFYDFPNCLPYRDLDECVTKLQYALQNDPEPLSDNTKLRLSWEGATERLMKAAAITRLEASRRAEMEKERTKAVKFHLNTCRRSQFVTNLFNGKTIKKISSKLSANSDS